VVDVNGNDRADAGDGFGFHGVNDLSSQTRPQPLTVRADALNAAVIRILMTRGEDGRLVPIPAALAATDGFVAGTVTGAQGPVVIVLVPAADGGHAVAAIAADDGSFRVAAKPGQYRLCAVSDLTGDGILGAGDLVATRGWGDDEPLGLTPAGELGLSELALTAVEQPPAGVPPIVVGRVTGVQVEGDATIQVAFCTDEALRQEAFSVAADAAGRFVAAPEPGTYYLRATVDQTGDGVLGVGDMLGFYGVEDLLGQDTPQPLALVAGVLRTDADIAISARMDEDGRLETYTAPEDADTNAPGNEPGE